MKKLLLITGVLLIAYVVMMSALSPSAEIRSQETAATIAQETTRDVYTVIDENNRVVVLLNGVAYMRTDTLVSSLPKSDQTRLKKGIKVYDKKELKRLLEDYCS